MDIKKGIPLYPNLVNLKSNTMKNTLQRYGHFHKMQEVRMKKCMYVTDFLQHACFLLATVDNLQLFRSESPVSGSHGFVCERVVWRGVGM